MHSCPTLRRYCEFLRGGCYQKSACGVWFCLPAGRGLLLCSSVLYTFRIYDLRETGLEAVGGVRSCPSPTLWASWRYLFFCGSEVASSPGVIRYEDTTACGLCCMLAAQRHAQRTGRSRQARTHDRSKYAHSTGIRAHAGTVHGPTVSLDSISLVH